MSKKGEKKSIVINRPAWRKLKTEAAITESTIADVVDKLVEEAEKKAENEKKPEGEKQ